MRQQQSREGEISSHLMVLREMQTEKYIVIIESQRKEMSLKFRFKSLNEVRLLYQQGGYSTGSGHDVKCPAASVTSF